ncbi:MAG: hypothetical protein SPH31_07170 [Arcanobacterium sp.]|nr:hypothetical protein [Arcanobacterium sp.]
MSPTLILLVPKDIIAHRINEAIDESCEFSSQLADVAQQPVEVELQLQNPRSPLSVRIVDKLAKSDEIVTLLGEVSGCAGSAH